MTLGSLEIEILNTIWTLQSNYEDINISVKDIVDYLSQKGIKRAYTTVKTVMDRLSAKELLVRYRSGKKFYYKTIMDKDEMIKNAIEEILGQFFNGNHMNLVQFIEKEFLNLVKE